MPVKMPVVFPLMCLSLVGCRSPFDGTWLFQWDLASVDVQSNCDLEGEEVQTRGDDYEWIDIYTTSGGALGSRAAFGSVEPADLDGSHTQSSPPTIPSGSTR